MNHIISYVVLSCSLFILYSIFEKRIHKFTLLLETSLSTKKFYSLCVCVCVFFIELGLVMEIQTLHELTNSVTFRVQLVQEKSFCCLSLTVSKNIFNLRRTCQKICSNNMRAMLITIVTSLLFVYVVKSRNVFSSSDPKPERQTPRYI